jgi:hypothetical protein
VQRLIDDGGVAQIADHGGFARIDRRDRRDIDRAERNAARQQPRAEGDAELAAGEGESESVLGAAMEHRRRRVGA